MSTFARRLLPVALLACQAPVEPGFNDLHVEVVEGSEAVNGYFIAVAESADDTLQIALEGLTDQALADALLDAHARGVQVELVIDFDERDAPAVDALIDGGLQVTLADDGITYFDFNLNADVTWSSEHTRMTHHFAIGDGTDVVLASLAGDSAQGGSRVVISGMSQDVGQDMGFEHAQVYGGADAVETTFYDDLAKSAITNRHEYPLTASGDVLSLWQGPQHRSMKRMIDAVYGTRANVWVVTEDLSDPGLGDILQEKARDGFDVEVIVGSSFALAPREGDSSMDLVMIQVRDDVVDDAPRVTFRQVDSDAPLPTLILVDTMKARDGRFHAPHAFVSTQPLYSAGRLYRDREILTDQLMDDTLMVLRNDGAPGPTMQSLIDLYETIRSQSEVIE